MIAEKKAETAEEKAKLKKVPIMAPSIAIVIIEKVCYNMYTIKLRKVKNESYENKPIYCAYPSA